MIVVLASVGILIMGAMRHRLPRWNAGGPLLAKAVLVAAGIALAWSAVAVPFISTAALSGSLIQHLTLLVAATGMIAFSLAAWSMRPPQAIGDHLGN